MELTYGNVWLIERYMSFVYTTKKPTSGLGKGSKVVKKMDRYCEFDLVRSYWPVLVLGRQP